MTAARVAMAVEWGIVGAWRALALIGRSLAKVGQLDDAGAEDPTLAGAGTGRGSHRPDPNLIVAEAFETFQADVHSFALHATKDADIAADVAQEAFVRLLGEVRANGSPENVRAWLFRVASNLVLTGHRRRSVFDRYRRLLARPDVSHDTPERAALADERVERLRTALLAVPSDARVGLLLAAQGFAGREIADAIGRTELATRTLLCRARIQLRDELTSFEEAR